MRHFLPFLFLLVFSVRSSAQQLILNIEKTDGVLLQYAVSNIDSITYSYYEVVVITDSISNISVIEATSGGELTYDNSANIISRGVCYDTIPTPTLLSEYSADGVGMGIFASTMTGLQPGQHYYVRAYAETATDTFYGNQVEFVTDYFNVGSGATDYDGNIYTGIIIGSQEWLVQNLRSSYYRNGDAIPEITDNNQWSDLSTGAFSWYDNNSDYDVPHGKLYNHYAVTDARQLCPVSWEMPYTTDWDTLRFAMGLTSGGGLLKTTGTIQNNTGLWETPNNGATNESGFSAEPSGIRFGSGTFNEMGTLGLWSNFVTGPNPSSVETIRVTYSNAGISTVYAGQNEGLSVRCFRQLNPVVQGIGSVPNQDKGPYTATVRAFVKKDGFSPIIEKGFYWDTVPNPSSSSNQTISYASSDSIIATINGLEPSTTYYFKAFATNNSYTGSGTLGWFSTDNNYGNGAFDDYGNNYPSIVQPDSSYWLSENVRGNVSCDGIEMNEITDATAWSDTTDAAFCYYDNTLTNGPEGALYNWYGTVQPWSGSLKDACPCDWHVPNNDEWLEMIEDWGGSNLAGGKFKSISSDWILPNVGATNVSGFNALPVGMRDSSGTFTGTGAISAWWSSSSVDSNNAYYFYVEGNSVQVGQGVLPKQAGLSVRCVKD